MAQDISKVSSAFIAKVDAAIEGGVKKAADTKEEYAKLGEMLSGCKNEHETTYIKEKMEEYNTKYKLGDLRSRASGFVRQTVDNIKSRFKPKKALDKNEAESLVDELRRAVQENRVEDEEYIREELHQAGFDDLLKEFDKEMQKSRDAESKPAEEAKEEQPVKSETKTENEQNKGAETSKDQPDIEKPRKKNPFDKKPDSTKPKEAPKRGRPAEPSKPAEPTEPTEPSKPVEPKKTEKAHIDEASQARGYAHADNIVRESHDVFVNGDYIKDEINKVDRNSTFSFVGKLKSQMDGKVFKNIKGKITYKEMAHVAANLLNQAKDLKQGLEKTQAWKDLKAEFDYVNRRKQSKASLYGPENIDVMRMDAAIDALYYEMNKVIEK